MSQFDDRDLTKEPWDTSTETGFLSTAVLNTLMDSTETSIDISTEPSSESLFTTTNIVNTVCEIFVAMATVFGNGLVLLAIYREPQLQTITNYFVASLAAADLLVGALGIPCAQLGNYGYPKEFYGCLMVNCAILILTQISIFGLLVISLERFLAIKYPFWYKSHCTGKLAAVVIVLSWILAICVGLTPVFGWNLLKTYSGQCSFLLVIDLEFMVYFNFLGCVLLPLVIMLAFYSYMFHVVRCQVRKIAALQVYTTKTETNLTVPTEQPRKSSIFQAFRFSVAQGADNASAASSSSGRRKKSNFASETHAAKWFAIVLAVFALCWLPIHIMNTILLLTNKVCGLCLTTAVLLSHANSAVNPVLYAYANTKFKTAFRKIFGLPVLHQDPSLERSVSIAVVAE